ncbi:MAG TPA: hypothetical protein VMT95_09055 [Candidatus Binatia bacterium]|nr:hypothetical protein [Candidatus Binatia bacterium]
MLLWKGLSRRAIAASIAVVLLAGCLGNGARVIPPAGGGGVTSGTRTPLTTRARKYDGLVFVSDIDSGIVWVCRPNFGDIRTGFLPPFTQLSGSSYPVQIAEDAEGTIYVANAQVDAGGDGSITEYARGSLSPSTTLTAGLNTTLGVAVDARGTVYASNELLGSIEVFPKGKTVPRATITTNLLEPAGLAVDKAGNLYIADGAANAVLRLAHGSKTPEPLHLRGLRRPMGVAVDSRGNLYVANLLAASSYVGVYPPGATRPSRSIVVRGNVKGAIGELSMLSIAPGDLLIVSAPITANTKGGPPLAVADGFAYGQTGPSWVEYDQGVSYTDVVFQPAQ